nr:hypothetical protein [Tanacetum cinerariifolium]
MFEERLNQNESLITPTTALNALHINGEPPHEEIKCQICKTSGHDASKCHWSRGGHGFSGHGRSNSSGYGGRSSFSTGNHGFLVDIIASESNNGSSHPKGMNKGAEGMGLSHQVTIMDHLHHASFLDTCATIEGWIPDSGTSGNMTSDSTLVLDAQPYTGTIRVMIGSMSNFLSECGITYRISCPYTPQENRVTERKNRHFPEIARALLFHSHLPNHFGYDAYAAASFLINRIPSRSLSYSSPYELLFHFIPYYSIFHTFSCLCYPFLGDRRPNKLSSKSTPCIFLGYAPSHRGYLCYDSVTPKTYTSRHVTFYEDVFPSSASSPPSLHTSTASIPVPPTIYTSHIPPFYIAPSSPTTPPSHHIPSSPLYHHHHTVGFFMAIYLKPLGFVDVKRPHHRTGMSQCKPLSTPISHGRQLSRYSEIPMDDPLKYQSIVDRHRVAVKRILRYLRGTSSHGLTIRRSSDFALHAYSDADWADCLDDRRSTTGYCLYLGPNLISWSSKKQHTVARSSTKAEYRALASTATELHWVMSVLQELHISLPCLPTLWCDNIGATYLAVNPVFHQRMKNLEIDLHFVRDIVLAVNYVSTVSQIADVLTKGLSSARFSSLRSKLHVATPISLGGGIFEIV